MALSPKRIEEIKQQWGDQFFDAYANEDHYDLKNDLMNDLTDQELDNFDENDFKALTGLDYKSYDAKLEQIRKNNIIEDFNDYKSQDMSLLDEAIEKAELSWVQNKLYNLKQELEKLEHDGSSDLGYHKKHVMDRIHKRIM